jgi:hypothetical protein
MECPMVPKCAFFNDRMANMPETAAALKNTYCQKDYENCARYLVKQATGVAHETLWPNEKDKVDEIIAEIKSRTL